MLYFFSLLDASLNVRSSLIDIQGNTFESLTGKPFISLQPTTSNVNTVYRYLSFMNVAFYIFICYFYNYDTS